MVDSKDSKTEAISVSGAYSFSATMVKDSWGKKQQQYSSKSNYWTKLWRNIEIVTSKIDLRQCTGLKDIKCQISPQPIQSASFRIWNFPRLYSGGMVVTKTLFLLLMMINVEGRKRWNFQQALIHVAQETKGSIDSFAVRKIFYGTLNIFWMSHFLF